MIAVLLPAGGSAVWILCCVVAAVGMTAVLSPAAAPVQLLDVLAVKEKLRCSERTVYRLADAGRMPRPVKLGTLVRWNQAEIDQWIADGCPSCRTGKGAAR
ncbi:MAG: helix-turn-helix transcriptional regulator [Pirellulales bacterium]